MDLFITGFPGWVKKAVEMGRYGASELMRNKNFQKKAVNYGISKLTPFIQDSVGTAMNQLSTKVRPKKKYKTDRPELDGRGLDIHNAILKVAPKKVLFYQAIIIPALVILFMNNFSMMMREIY